MAQHTYDNEAVQELLNWAKKMIETKNYPTERYQVNKCTTIIDGKSYLESLIAMISRTGRTLISLRTASTWTALSSVKRPSPITKAFPV